MGPESGHGDRESRWTRDNKEEEWTGANACRVQSKPLCAPEAFLTQSALSPHSLPQLFVESLPQPYRALETMTNPHLPRQLPMCDPGQVTSSPWTSSSPSAKQGYKYLLCRVCADCFLSWILSFCAFLLFRLSITYLCSPSSQPREGAQ